MESIDAKILEAQSAHNEAMARYQAQQLVLDSLLSEVHTTKQLAEVLESQKRTLEGEMDDIRGLMNPLRRLPVETLSHIFSMTAPTVDATLKYYRECGRNANRIMLVCRSWRDVALHCPALWTSIFIDLTAEIPITEVIWERFVKRVKRSPVFIFLSMSIGWQEGNEKSKSIEATRRIIGSALQVCDLRRLPVIQQLKIRASETLGTKVSLSLISQFPVGELDQLVVDCTDEDPESEWWSAFFTRFPPFNTLKINEGYDFAFDNSTSFPSIKNLALKHCTRCAIPDLLRSTPNLEHLRVGYSYDAEDVTPSLTEYNLPNLKSLSIEGAWSFPEISLLRAPNLTAFRLYADEGEPDCDYTGFLQPCQLLVTVEVNVENIFIPFIAEAAPNILHLTLRVTEPHLLSISRWEENGHSVTLPFPILRTLTLHYFSSDKDVSDFQYFDELVATRCLPRSNAASKLDSSLSPLQTLTIIHYNSDIRLALMSSMHYHTATACISGGTFSVTLSWVLGHDEALALSSDRFQWLS